MPLPATLKPQQAKNLAKKVFGNRYKLHKLIGTGSYADVYLVHDLRSGAERALKLLTLDDEDSSVEALREANLLASLCHPHVLQLADVFVDGHCVCLLTEYCPAGTLFERIGEHRRRNLTFRESEVVCFLTQLLDALAYIHSKKILHRDIKTKNIFLSAQSFCESPSLRLGDFGISRVLFWSTEQASTLIGTPFYLSPEMFEQGRYDRKTDIWAVGCVLYELCYLQQPFMPADTLVELMLRITQQAPIFEDWSYSGLLRTMCQGMLNKHPALRPEAEELLRMSLTETHLDEYQDSHRFACHHLSKEPSSKGRRPNSNATAPAAGAQTHNPRKQWEVPDQSPLATEWLQATIESDTLTCTAGASGALTMLQEYYRSCASETTDDE